MEDFKEIFQRIEEEKGDKFDEYTEKLTQIFNSKTEEEKEKEELDLFLCGVKVKSAKVISNVLANNSSLLSLKMWYNEIGDEGAKAIAKSFPSNTTLTSLNISINQIGDEGIEEILKMLTKNSTIKHLNLAYNKFTQNGAKLISDYLTKENLNIKDIDLTGNDEAFTDEICEELFKNVLENNKTIENITISSTYFSHKTKPNPYSFSVDL